MEAKFTYSGTTDKCYGLAGRAISLKVLDNNFRIHHVTIDNAAGEDAITFTPDFFFYSNPRYSAKITWNEMLRQYQLLVGMVVGDIVCRSRVQSGHAIDDARVSEMQALVDEEGREHCSLDDDEISAVFSKTYRYLDRVFADSRVSQLARTVAAALEAKRSLTGSEMADLLDVLD